MADRPERLREAHAHLAMLGRSLTMIDLCGCASAAELLEAFAVRRQAGGALQGHGARPEAWTTPQWPSRAEFDDATGDEPACAWCFDHHALLANSAALRRVDLLERGPDDGFVGRDAEGWPTGVLREGAAEYVWNGMPKPTGEERREQLLEAMRALGAFHEIHDLKAEAWLPPVLSALKDAGPGEQRFVLWPLVEDLDELIATMPFWRSDRVRLGGGKIFVDGTLNSRTAWMLHPYADGRPQHPTGMELLTARGIESAIRRCDKRGLPLAAHAIGDAAVRSVLDALERVQPKTRGWRIEHAELIDEADVPRIARLADEMGLIISQQPCHLLTDIEVLRRAVPDRLPRVLPLRELIDAGLVPGGSLIFGSDVPIVRANPEDSILAATRRRREDMPDTDAITPEQAITETEAWSAFAAS
ncbi:MAG: amidohydrolase family protein [Planctomycetota bacterium]